MFIYNKAYYSPDLVCGHRSRRKIVGTSIYLEPCRRRSILYSPKQSIRNRYFLAFPRTLYKIDYTIFPSSQRAETHYFNAYKMKVGWVLTDNIVEDTIVYPPALKNVGRALNVCQDVPLLEYRYSNEVKKTVKIPKSIMMYPVDFFWDSSFNNSLDNSCYALFKKSQSISSFKTWQHATKVNPNWYPGEKDIDISSVITYKQFLPLFPSSLETVEITIDESHRQL